MKNLRTYVKYVKEEIEFIFLVISILFNTFVSLQFYVEVKICIIRCCNS